MHLKLGLLFLLMTVFAVVINSATASVDDRFCRNMKTTSNFIETLLHFHFSFIDVPEWARRSFVSALCANKGLNFIPMKAIPIVTEFLDLSYNELRIISSNAFKGLNNLTILNLDANCQRRHHPEVSPQPNCKSELYIKSGAFEELRNLRVLLLNFNYLRKFPPKLPFSLLYLSIDHTMLGDITTPLRKYASNLNGISARRNCEINIGTIFGCPRKFYIASKFSNSLEILYLHRNAWKVVPSYFIQSKLRVLDLSSNPISKLHRNDFVNGTGLKVLMLHELSSTAHRKLIIENGVFDILIELEVLIISHNWIEHIQNNLFFFNTKLKLLDISKNNLYKSIYNPSYLAHLRLLTFLDISANAENKDVHYNEMRLGPSYANLTSLETLFIGFKTSKLIYHYTKSSVQFDFISDQSIEVIASMKNLKKLSIAGISLKWLNSSSLQKLNNLESLDASRNSIKFRSQKIEQLSHDYVGTFCTNQKLSLRKDFYTSNLIDEAYAKLALNVNNYNLNDNCISTNVLDLSNNMILNLSNHLTFLDRACVVDISYNNILHIHRNDFEYFNRLQILVLDHNPLHIIDSHALSNLFQLKILKLEGIRLNSRHTSLRFLHDLSNKSKVAVRLKGDDGPAIQAFLHHWNRLTKNAFFNSITSLDISDNLFYPDLSNSTFVFHRVINLTARGCLLTNVLLKRPLLPSNNSLISLDLGNNELFQLPTRAVTNLRNLQHLMLDHNRIFNLSGSFLLNLTSLQRLVVSHNKISYIQSGFFSRSKLKHLDLHHNNIAHLGDDILSLEFLSFLDYLDIRKNELDCACSVWNALQVWITLPESQHVIVPGFVSKCTSDLDVVYGGCVACQSPFNLRDVSLLWFISHPSCEVSLLSAYAACFSAFFFLFLLFGTLGYSKWIKRVVIRKVNEQFRFHSLLREPALQNDAHRRRRKAFVVFDLENNEIGDWIDNRLCQAMDNGNPPLFLKIHGKDNSCGAAPSQQVIRNIINCGKTLLFLTCDFCLEKNCRFILSALEELRYSMGDDHLVLIAWTGDNGAPRVPLEIQATLNRKKQCFLKFDSTNDDEEMFFETLRTALLDTTEAADSAHE